MRYKLRRNVIQKDWHNAIVKYYCLHGRRPEYIEINLRTFDMLCVYVAKHYGEWTAVLERKLEHVYTGRFIVGTEENIYLDGVKIFIRNDLEKEVMRIW